MKDLTDKFADRACDIMRIERPNRHSLACITLAAGLLVGGMALASLTSDEPAKIFRNAFSLTP